MKISLSRDQKQAISDIITNTPPYQELEWRIGSFTKYFNNDIQYHKYNEIIKVLSLDTNFTKTNEQYIVETYKDNVRKILRPEKVELQKKERILNYDIQFTKCSIRLSRSSELKADEVKGNVLNTRNINRTSFKTNDYVIDASIVGTDNKIVYELEIELYKRDLTIAIDSLKLVLSILYPETTYLIENNERLKIIKNYNELFTDEIIQTQEQFKKQGKSYFFPKNTIYKYENRPVNIKEDTKLKGYCVTNKLDGVGYDLFIDRYGVYLLSSNDIEKLSTTINQYSSYNHIFRGEWKDKTFYIFDVLKFNGKTVYNIDNLFKRLEFVDVNKLNSILKSENVTIALKRFEYNTESVSGPIRETMRWMYDKYQSLAYELNDGLIFTYVDSDYKSKRIYKFKWTSKMSIDFECGNKVDNYYIPLVVNKLNNSVPFNDYKIFLNEDNPLYKLITKGVVVECVWDYNNKYFIPTRIRFDKTRGNFITVAEDVLQDILHPIELDVLIKNNEVDCLETFDKESNIEKRKLIDEYANGVGLDLGFGKGGDIHKYNNKVVELFGVEPFDINREEALRRISKKKDLKTQITVLPFKAQETLKIKEKVNKEVDFVASFFSLSFFFKSEEDLTAFCNTVSGNLKIGGYFIGTTIDGDKMYNLLKGKDVLKENGCFEIKKEYKDDEGTEKRQMEKFGQKIYIRLENTIVDQEEWLVWFPIFEKMMNKFGLKLVKSEYFVPVSSMNKSEAMLFDCYRSFVFIREKSSNELITEERKVKEKLKLKQEKKQRLKMLSMDEKEEITLYDEQLYRVGTIGEGSCFFHSVFTLIDPKYLELSEEDRKEFASIFRNILADSLPMSDWRKFGNGNLALTSLLIHLGEKYPEKDWNIPAKDVVEFVNKVRSRFAHIDIEEDIVYEEYLKKLRDCDVWVGQEEDSIDLFEFLSDILNLNIFIIKDTTKQPYNLGGDCELLYKKDRKNIVLLWVRESHYEAIESEREKIFDFNDELIQNIYKELC